MLSKKLSKYLMPGYHQAGRCVMLQPCQTFASESSDDDVTQPQAKHFPIIKTPMLPPGTFNNKVAFITGGGTGLGKEMATLFSQLGASVFIMSRRFPVLEATAKEITSKTGGKVIPFAADVRDAELVKTAVDECVSKLGLPNVIVNNAAGNFISPTERLSTNAFKTIVDIVLNGTSIVTMDIAKRLIAAKQGASFLAITTLYTTLGSGYVVPSAAAKSGVQTMHRSLASEWGKYGLRFNCVAPGAIRTEGAFGRLDPTGEFRSKAKHRVPTGRLGDTMELANLVSYVSSDYASWMTGEVITFDGGELPFLGGSFNILNDVEPEKWDMMEEMIRNTNKKSKLYK